jgi:phosphonopyruvate decarboxylase
MIKAEDFINSLKSHGYSFFAGVPCSFLKPLINRVIDTDGIEYVPATSEGEAIGIAAGANLAGRKAVVMFQNSGLGNAVNPLTSLNYPFRIPVLMIITLRGQTGIGDEPQHELMGQITKEMLSTLQIPWAPLPPDIRDVDSTIESADQVMSEAGLPYALVMTKGTVASYELTHGATERNTREVGELIGQFKGKGASTLSRLDAIKKVDSHSSLNDIIVATTGKIGRELFSLGDNWNKLYVVGSMGCASGIGFGIQIVLPTRTVIVLDGDGAALMKMGSLATIGHHKPSKFLHIILDNEAYESTGGQPTVSTTADFAAIGSACGYSKCWRIEHEQGIRESLENARKAHGPFLIHIKVKGGSDPSLSRPNVSPRDVKNRFIKFLAEKTD